LPLTAPCLKGKGFNRILGDPVAVVKEVFASELSSCITDDTA